MDAFRVERMTPEGWERVRAIRLRALADTPDAFGTTLDEETATTPERWQERLALTTDATFVATRGGRDVGLVVGGVYDGRREDAGLYAMWVDPEARGRGIAGALVDAVVAWARAGRRNRIVLDVADGNATATRLYERKGFVPTGVTGSLPPPREHVREHQRALDLRSPRTTT